MRILNLILLCVLPKLLFGQYTYFNLSISPALPNITAISTANLLVRNDTLITYCATLDNGNQISRSHYYVSNSGSIVNEAHFPMDNYGQFYRGNGDCIIPLDNGYLLAGGFADNVLIYPHGRIYRLDNSFQVEWSYIDDQNQIDTISAAEFAVAKVLQDGSIITVGEINVDTSGIAFSGEYGKIQLTKLSNSGTLIWHKEKSFVTSENYDLNRIYLRVSDVFEMSNDDILVFGMWSNKYEPFALRFDNQGNYMSQVYWGNPTENDWFPWVVQIGVDEFILVYQHAVGVSDIGEDFVEHKPRIGYFHADSMTITNWHLYEHQHYWGNITDFEKTPDGGYVVLGFGSDDSGEFMGEAYMMKIDSNFNEVWYQTYLPPIEYHSPDAWDLEVTSDGGLAFVGNFAVVGEAYYSSWVVKTDACGDSIYNGCPVGVNDLNNLNSGFSFYPNPAQKSIRISSDKRFDQVVIREVTGRILLSENIQGPTKEMNLDISGLASGLYMLELCTEDCKVMAQRLMVE